jgi:hypothetical protein
MIVAIISSPNYIDALPWSAKAFDRAWPDCPYPIYVGYHNLIPDIPENWIPCKLGKDKGWIRSMIAFLRRIPDTHLLLILEDYILIDVDQELIEIAENQVMRDSVGMVRLVPTPGPTLPYDRHEELGEIDKTARYSLSLQASMWKKHTLLDILLILDSFYYKSAWNFELDGSRNLSQFGINRKFLGLHRGAMGYHNLYRRGKRVKEVDVWMMTNL